MGYDLYGKKGNFRWTTRFWRKVLILANENGWQPAGTQPPKDRPVKQWEGSYIQNSGQFVTKKDAFNLATALEKALQNLSDKELPIPGFSDYSKSGGKCDENLPITHFFSGKNKSSLKNFIDFCKKGEFTIN